MTVTFRSQRGVFFDEAMPLGKLYLLSGTWRAILLCLGCIPGELAGFRPPIRRRLSFISKYSLQESSACQSSRFMVASLATSKRKEYVR